MSQKLIIPAEVKICATCSFWDGERQIDGELALVVIQHSCHGECIVRGEQRAGLNNQLNVSPDCMWEHLAPDQLCTV